MRRSVCSPVRRFVTLLLLGACVAVLIARAGQPSIQLIQLFLSDKVLIHFDTEANLTYELQVSETPTTNGETSGTWTNLYVTPNLPFPDHYVIVDTRTNRQRFYRLQVTR